MLCEALERRVLLVGITIDQGYPRGDGLAASATPTGGTAGRSPEGKGSHRATAFFNPGGVAFVWDQLVLPVLFLPLLVVLPWFLYPEKPVWYRVLYTFLGIAFIAGSVAAVIFGI